MNILLIFPGFIVAFIIVFYYECKIKNIINAAYKNKNRVHFYVARDKSNDRLWLYLNKPIRSKHLLQWIGSGGSKSICIERSFEDVGLNADDYKDLRWEDEPVEVFLNLND